MLNSTSYLYQNNCIVLRLGYVTRKCYGTNIELSCQFAPTIQITLQSPLPPYPRYRNYSEIQSLYGGPGLLNQLLHHSRFSEAEEPRVQMHHHLWFKPSSLSLNTTHHSSTP